MWARGGEEAGEEKGHLWEKKKKKKGRRTEKKDFPFFFPKFDFQSLGHCDNAWETHSPARMQPGSTNWRQPTPPGCFIPFAYFLMTSPRRSIIDRRTGAFGPTGTGSIPAVSGQLTPPGPAARRDTAHGSARRYRSTFLPPSGRRINGQPSITFLVS